MAKKIGYFFLSFVPIISVLVLQLTASVFMMGVSTFVNVLTHKSDLLHLYDTLMDVWMSVDFNSYVMVIYALLAIAVYGIWYYLQFYADYRPQLKKNFHPLILTGIVLLVPGTQYLCSYLITLLSTIFPNWLTAYEELLENAGMDDSLTFGLLLYSVILAPVCEELLCRGVTMSCAKRALPFWAANILQAVLFGVLHMNWLQGTYAFCLGLVLGFICEKGGSIYFSILFHMLFNFWGTVLEQFISYGDSVFSFFFWLLFGIAATAVGLLLFVLGVKNRAKHNGTLYR